MATKEQIQERVTIMQAWLDGKEVESIDTGFTGALWTPLGSNPSFDWGTYRYRIKPKIRKVIIGVFSYRDSTKNSNASLAYYPVDSNAYEQCKKSSGYKHLKDVEFEIEE